MGEYNLNKIKVIPANSTENGAFSSSEIKQVDIATVSDMFHISTSKRKSLKVIDSNSSIVSLSKGSALEKNKKISNSQFDVEIEKKIKKALSLLKTEDQVDGEVTKTQIFLEFLSESDSRMFLEVFQKLWLRLYRDDTVHFRNFVCIASAMDYDILKDRADALIFGAVSHQDFLVQEAAIRAIESWENKDHLAYLNSIREFELPWLEDYKRNVILNLEGA